MVGNFDWSSTQTMGTQIFGFALPDKLFDEPWISDKLNGFRYFRSAIKLTIRVTSPRTVAGKLIAAYSPCWNLNPTFGDGSNTDTGTDALDKVSNTSGYDHTLVSASSSETVELLVPYISVYRALDLTSWHSGEIAYVTFSVLHPLVSNDAIVPDAEVTVFASFVEPEAFLPGEYTVSEPIAHVYPQSDFHGSKEYTPGSQGAKPKKIVAPNTRQDSRVINPFFDFCSSTGESTAVNVAAQQDAALNPSIVAGGRNVDEMSLNHIISTPMLRTTSTFNAVTTVPVEIPVVAVRDAVGWQHDYLGFIANQFQYYTGSIKVKIYITSTIFTNARLMFFLAPSGSSPTKDAWKSCYHKQVEVQGDGEVDFMIPYNAVPFASRTSSNETQLGLFYRVLSYTTPTAGTNSYLAVYRAAGPDLKFSVMKERCFTLHSGFTIQSNPRADFGKEFEKFAPDTIGYDGTLVTSSDSYSHLNDLLGRYFAYQDTDDYDLTHPDRANLFQYNGALNDNGATTANASFIYGIEMFMLLFLFNRGSVKFKILASNRPIRRNWTASTVDYSQLLGRGDAGAVRNAYLTVHGHVIPGAVMDTPVNPVLDLTFPHYSAFPIRANRKQSGLYGTTDWFVYWSLMNSRPEAFICKAAGRDFQLHYLVPPPVGNFDNLDDKPGAYGLSGLTAFLTEDNVAP